MKIKLLILFLTCSLIGTSQKQVDDQFNSWWTYSGTHKITNKFSVSTLYSWRRSDFVKNWQQSLLRTGLNFKVTDNFTITPGYDWLVNFPYGKQPALTQSYEHRPYEQFTIKNKIGRFYIKHRYRIEQRFLQKTGLNSNNEKESYGYKFRNRIRYRLTFTLPINHKTLDNKTLFLSVYNEVFINLGKGAGIAKPFNQNWFNTSLGYKVNNQISVKLGYQNQYLIKGNGNIERNHTFMFGISYNFDFRK